MSQARLEHELLDYERTYRIRQNEGIAWHYLGDETAPDEDTEWTGIEEPTGRVVMVMVGDDRRFSIDPADCEPVKESEFCHSCGQVGCMADPREED